MTFSHSITRPQLGVLATNTVLRKTYALLGLTLVFSAITAGLAMVLNAPPVNPILMLVGYFGLLFLTMGLRNSVWGLVSIFAFTGFMGYTLGPVLNFYIHAFSNGNQLVMTAFGATGLIFFGLSAYALTTKKSFNYLGAFLATAVTIAFIAALVSIFVNIPVLNLLIAGAFALISSGYILFQTSLIINGGETNYIMATITLYVSLLNLFLSLLQIFAAFAGNRK
ncbi:MAG: Bax inhibitor-1/YccA family protein [Gammaproteobacteria bacterium]|nr:Bax inhibitor-1/YccA family protein [Gammaproteobacteria bacterium]